MKKALTMLGDGIRAAYDFSTGVRVAYADLFHLGNDMRLIDADLAEAFSRFEVSGQCASSPYSDYEGS
jgi:hypothetical protein